MPSYDSTALPHSDMSVPNDGCRDGSTHLPPTPNSFIHVPLRGDTPLNRLKIDISCSPAKWAAFCAWWQQFQNGSSIPAEQAPAQLLKCLEDELFSTATRAIGQKIDALDVAELLLELKQVAFIPVAIGMR